MKGGKLHCPGVAEYHSGAGAERVHLGGCCTGFAELPASRQHQLGVKILGTSPPEPAAKVTDMVMRRSLTAAAAFQQAAQPEWRAAFRADLRQKADLAGTCAYLLDALARLSPDEATIACSVLIDAGETGDLAEWVQERLAEPAGTVRRAAGIPTYEQLLAAHQELLDERGEAARVISEQGAELETALREIRHMREDISNVHSAMREHLADLGSRQPWDNTAAMEAVVVVLGNTLRRTANMQEPR